MKKMIYIMYKAANLPHFPNINEETHICKKVYNKNL